MHAGFQIQEVTNHIGLSIALHNQVNATNQIEGAACIRAVQGPVRCIDTHAHIRM